jgi:DNA-binding transcriptional ArsR family regulator
MATLLGVLSHPDRIRIVEELRGAELDVAALQKILGVSHSRTSQHLSILRSHRIVGERRDGRHVHYRLTQPEMAKWLFDGLAFLERDHAANHEIKKALDATREIWAGAPAAGS